MISARRLLALVLAAAVVLIFSGCATIKPGSLSLSQPAGIGPLKLGLTFCTASPEPSETTCGAVSETLQGQMLLGLIVPAGSATPNTIAASPGPGAAATTFSRNAEVGQALLQVGAIPAGSELVGYLSAPVPEVAGQAFEWALAGELGAPASGDGGSYGRPFTAGVRSGWRSVSAEFPAGRPVICATSAELEVFEIAPGRALCNTVTQTGNEATVGISDLKVKAPAAATVGPGAKVKLPFVLDFATSATEPPRFALAATTSLPGVKAAVSNSTFLRGPSDPATNRAPATTRQALLTVPASARLGSYEVTFTATAAQGGAATATARLLVRPQGVARVSAPRSIPARVAAGRGVPVELTAPIAGTRFKLTLKGEKRLLTKTRTAGRLGSIPLRLRIGAAAALDLRDAGTPLRLEVKVNQPGRSKPLRFVRIVKLS